MKENFQKSILNALAVLWFSTFGYSQDNSKCTLKMGLHEICTKKIKISKEVKLKKKCTLKKCYGHGVVYLSLAPWHRTHWGLAVIVQIVFNIHLGNAKSSVFLSAFMACLDWGEMESSRVKLK